MGLAKGLGGGQKPVLLTFEGSPLIASSVTLSLRGPPDLKATDQAK